MQSYHYFTMIKNIYIQIAQKIEEDNILLCWFQGFSHYLTKY